MINQLNESLLFTIHMNHNHGQCTHVQESYLKMVCRAEERFADEIDASGEFKHGGDRGNQHIGGKAVDVSLGGVGINSTQLHRFRKVRDLGGDKVGEIIDKAVAEDRLAPTHHNQAALVSWNWGRKGEINENVGGGYNSYVNNVAIISGCGTRNRTTANSSIFHAKASLAC